MIVPQFWAEGRIQQRVAGRQITVRRFGWSDDSPIAAQSHADQRTREAFERVASGEALDRRESRRAYNGAEGLPIREEIVERHGDTVITRNGYGARCLNTPDVLFMDIDFEAPRRWTASGAAFGCALLAGPVAGFAGRTWLGGLMVALIVFAVTYALVRMRQRTQGDGIDANERKATQAIGRFLEVHPEWHLRVYRTPAGYRLLAMHNVFSPGDPALAACFLALGVDKVYVRMCVRQNCFRARVSAKPWRIGIGDHLRPRGVWPVPADLLPLREAWVARYERVASGHAACQFLGALGSPTVHPAAAEVQLLHDALSHAESGLPMA